MSAEAPIRRAMITFRPDPLEPNPSSLVETALFLGVRGDPALESTQLRWQVTVGPDDVVELESGGAYLEQLGGALFLTTKEPPPEIAADETPPPIGWIKWMAEQGRRSYQIQLAISRVGFDRVCALAENGKFPSVILTFDEDGPIAYGLSPNGEKKIWKNLESSVALIREYTFKYDLAQGL